MRRVVRLRHLNAICLILLFAVACAPAQPPAPTSAPAPKATEAAKPAPAPPTSKEAAKPAEAKPAAGLAREQVLRLASTNPPSLDPGLATDAISVDFILQMFDGLVDFDDKGALKGVQAEKWEVSADGLTYTFTLRQGPKWTDGKAVTAKDYEWAWKRNIDPKTASDYATTIYPIKNAEKIHKESMDKEQLGVTARDDRTLVVTLEQPTGAFLVLASTWTLFPLRQDVLEKHGDKWTDVSNIVTNGRYVLKEWRQDAQITLERNEDYWGEKPTLQRAVFRIFPEGAAEQALGAYEAGEIDSIGIHGFQIPAAQVQRIQGDARMSGEIKEYDESGTMFITVNNRKPHMKDPRVRMALGMSLDRQRILTQVLRRGGKPAMSLHPEGIFGRNPDAWPREDVQKAQELLAQAGYPNGSGFPEILFTYNTSEQWRLMSEYLQQRWKETLGINVRLDNMEFASFLKWRRGTEWETTGDVYRGGWFSDYEDPNNWFNVLWDSREDPGVFNSGWKNDEYDRIVRQAQGELDRARREQLYGQAEQILAREYPNIPVFHYGGRTLVKSNVEGFQPRRVPSVLPLEKIRIMERR